MRTAAAILCLVASSASLPAMNPPPAHTGEPPAALIIDADASTDAVLPGATRPLHQTVLGSPFDITLAEVLAREGDSVRTGDIIAVLDDRVARASLRVARFRAQDTSAINRAEAALERARTVLARTKAAHDSRVANSDELDEARTKVALAEADLAAAQNEHQRACLEAELATARLEQHLVRAPFDATVVRIHAEPGVVLSPGDPIAELATLDRVCAELHLPATGAAGLHKGAEYALDLGAPLSAVLPARILYIEPTIDPTSRTQRVVFEFTRFAPTPGLIVLPAQRLPTPADIARARDNPAALAVADE